MKLTLLLLTLTLSGCSAVAEMIPSLKYCDKVDYQRNGVDIDIKAKCKAPVG
jgi:uncharacterized protein YceK